MALPLPRRSSTRAVRLVLGPWVLSLLLLPLPLPSAAADDGLRAQRAGYRAALADLAAVRLERFDERVAELDDYPLVPYLHYRRLMRYISSASAEDVAGFRERWADTPLADIALRQWLDNLARRGRWRDYLEHVDRERVSGARAECRLHRAQLETGDREAAFAGARRLWQSERSQPDECDPLFERWRAAGELTDALAWQRMHLALQAGQVSLARYLVRFLDAGASRRLAEEYLALHGRPQRITRLARIRGGDAGAREALVVAHAIVRLARRDPAAAENAWRAWRDRLAFEPESAVAVRRAIVRGRIRQGDAPTPADGSWPPEEFASGTEPSLIAELARSAIADEDWPAVVAWLDRLPVAEARRSVWRYWRARARLAADTTDASATATLAALARERSYYGFLAADRLQQPLTMASAAVDVDDDELATLRARPGYRRARELRAIGDLGAARREIAWLIDQLDRRSLLVLAEQLRRDAWYRQAIRATIVGEHWDHLPLRFPLAHGNAFRAMSADRDIDLPWLWAVARQESAFMHDARSSAGALGIMQLLPSTARQTARRHDIELDSSWQLLDATRNIRIGAHYLDELFERYDENRILASIAYNAGPGRADRWRAQRGDLDPDAFVETVPFRETRRYLRNVLTFSYIYGQLLGAPTPFLYDHER